MTDTEDREIPPRTENARNWRHAEIKSTFDAVTADPANDAAARYARARDRWSDGVLSFQHRMNRVVSELWEGRSAEASRTAITGYVAEAGRLTDAFEAMSARIAAAADAVLRTKAAIPAPDGTGDAPAWHDQVSGGRYREIDEDAREAMEENYVKPFRAIDASLPVLPRPNPPDIAAPTTPDSAAAAVGITGAGSNPTVGRVVGNASAAQAFAAERTVSAAGAPGPADSAVTTAAPVSVPGGPVAEPRWGTWSRTTEEPATATAPQHPDPLATIGTAGVDAKIALAQSTTGDSTADRTDPASPQSGQPGSESGTMVPAVMAAPGMGTGAAPGGRAPGRDRPKPAHRPARPSAAHPAGVSDPAPDGVIGRNPPLATAPRTPASARPDRPRRPEPRPRDIPREEVGTTVPGPRPPVGAGTEDTSGKRREPGSAAAPTSPVPPPAAEPAPPTERPDWAPRRERPRRTGRTAPS